MSIKVVLLHPAATGITVASRCVWQKNQSTFQHTIRFFYAKPNERLSYLDVLVIEHNS